MNITDKAIKAAAELLGCEIIIKTDADFTPNGKRRVRLVNHAVNGSKRKMHIRWYVGNKAFRSLPLTAENARISNEWVNF